MDSQAKPMNNSYSSWVEKRDTVFRKYRNRLVELGMLPQPVDPFFYHLPKDRYRLIAVIQQRKANDPKRSFKVGIVSARSSA